MDAYGAFAWFVLAAACCNWIIRVEKGNMIEI